MNGALGHPTEATLLQETQAATAVVAAEEAVRCGRTLLPEGALAIFAFDDGEVRLLAAAGDAGPDWDAVGRLLAELGEAPFAGLEAWHLRLLRVGDELAGALCVHLPGGGGLPGALERGMAPLVSAVALALAGERLARARVEAAERAVRVHAVWSRLDEAHDEDALLRHLAEGASALWPVDGAAARWDGKGRVAIASRQAGAPRPGEALFGDDATGGGALQGWLESDLVDGGRRQRVHLVTVPLRWGGAQLGRLFLWRRRTLGASFLEEERDAAEALGDAAVRRLLDLRAAHLRSDGGAPGPQRLRGMVQALCLWTRLVERAPDEAQRARRAEAAVRLLRRLDAALLDRLGAAG